MRRVVSICICAAVLLVIPQFVGAEPSATNPGTPWPATDALGRVLPGGHDVGPPREGRFVGIFYFLCHQGVGGKEPRGSGPYDVSQILAADPEAIHKPDSPLWGPPGSEHYWGQPLYGYYKSDDAWVLRRHAQLLADAGVDTLIFDTTNAATYRDVYMKLCEVFTQVRRKGGRTPQIAFMVNTAAGQTAQELYKDLYAPGLYRELWFSWQGKPLLICDPKQASPEVQKFFTLRAAHWPFELVNTDRAWHWEATYPQPYGYCDDPAKPEEVIVSVAQNLRASDGAVTNMSRLNARGRSFHDGKMDPTPGAVNYGYNAQEQWKRALELDPPFVMETGWNEWAAGRYRDDKEPLIFVDQFSQEFSRDIEPMAGGHGDNYYYQLVANIRRYKGAPPLPKASPERTIRIDGEFDQWRDVRPEYTDDAGDTALRDHDGAGGLHYADHSGRNDLVAFKVAHDAENVYFYAKTREPLTPRSEPGWMWLMIDVDGDAKTGWEGYDLIVNRSIEDGTSWIEKNDGGWNWKKVAKVQSRNAGNELQLAIPRALFDAAGAAKKHSNGLSFHFKWADHLQRPGDVMDFYLSGDVAPEGRFAYTYRAE